MALQEQQQQTDADMNLRELQNKPVIPMATVQGAIGDHDISDEQRANPLAMFVPYAGNYGYRNKSGSKPDLARFLKTTEIEPATVKVGKEDKVQPMEIQLPYICHEEDEVQFIELFFALNYPRELGTVDQCAAGKATVAKLTGKDKEHHE